MCFVGWFAVNTELLYITTASGSRLEDLAQRLEALAVQHHVIHCNASTDVQVDADLLDSLTRQKTPNIVIAGTECLQRQLVNWVHTSHPGSLLTRDCLQHQLLNWVHTSHPGNLLPRDGLQHQLLIWVHTSHPGSLLPWD